MLCIVVLSSYLYEPSKWTRHLAFATRHNMQCFWAEFGKSGLGDLWSRLCEVHGFGYMACSTFLWYPYYLHRIPEAEQSKVWPLQCVANGQKDNSLCTTFLGPIKTVDQLVDIDLSIILSYNQCWITFTPMDINKIYFFLKRKEHVFQKKHFNLLH
jgi:hypothetical protein